MAPLFLNNPVYIKKLYTTRMIEALSNSDSPAQAGVFIIYTLDYPRMIDHHHQRAVSP